MVYSIESGQRYVHQFKTIVKYGSRSIALQYAEMVTYMGKTDEGLYIFMQPEKTTIALSSLMTIFPYSVGPDIYVPKPRKEPQYFR